MLRVSTDRDTGGNVHVISRPSLSDEAPNEIHFALYYLICFFSILSVIRACVFVLCPVCVCVVVCIV